MTANKVKDNSTIGEFDFVFWVNGTAFDTNVYLPNVTSGNVNVMLYDVIQCQGINNCFWKTQRVPAGTPDSECLNGACYKAQYYPINAGIINL